MSHLHIAIAKKDKNSKVKEHGKTGPLKGLGGGGAVGGAVGATIGGLSLALLDPW